jgi:Na+/H+ antiporter NhaD/arsenite permease-like protein
VVLEIIILVGTLLLISLRGWARIPIERASAALLGATAMVLFGFVPTTQLAAAVDWDTILLLIGMFLVVATLEGTGLFERLARMLVTRATSPFKLLLGVILLTAALSALVLNDAVVLFFTPILIVACRRLGRDPVPYLISEALAANLGSLATPVGNPQNAYIANHAGIAFHTYAQRMLPPTLLAILVAIILLTTLYRRELTTPFALPEEPSILPQPDARLSRFGLWALGGVALFLLASGPLGLSLSAVALSAGAILLVAGPMMGGPNGRRVLARVDWNILLLFIGLFILLAGVRGSDLFSNLLATLPATYARPEDLGVLALVTALLSNLVSNVPAVLLLSPALEGAPHDAWYVLATASTLAGNTTLVAAAANLIVAERAEHDGVALPLTRFLAAGVPITIASLDVALAWIIAT